MEDVKTEKVRVTNNSQAPQGVRGVSGVTFIRPGDTRIVEFDEASAKRASRLKFLSFDGGPLDHDGDGRKGGSEPSDREELKRQADELGIQYARNATNEKLKELIDAKLAE